MHYIDTTFETAHENINFDEVLLTEAEQGKKNKILRIWEPNDYTVVLGRACSIDNDIFLTRCRKDNIKIIKRISGGGTVLLGKGCLNYSVILPYNANKDLLSISKTYDLLLGLIRSAFIKNGIGLTHFLPSDLALNNKKVSGNAQARRRISVLFHGTFLYNFDIDRINFYLKEPRKAPAYRNKRTHKDFLANLPLSAAKLTKIIRESFLN